MDLVKTKCKQKNVNHITEYININMQELEFPYFWTGKWDFGYWE